MLLHWYIGDLLICLWWNHIWYNSIWILLFKHAVVCCGTTVFCILFGTIRWLEWSLNENPCFYIFWVPNGAINLFNNFKFLILYSHYCLSGKKIFYCFVVNGFCHENIYSESSGTQVRISLTWEFNYSDYYSRSGGVVAQKEYGTHWTHTEIKLH